MDCDDVRMKIVKYLDFSWKIPDIYCTSMSKSKHAKKSFTGFNHNWEY